MLKYLVSSFTLAVLFVVMLTRYFNPTCSVAIVGILVFTFVECFLVDVSRLVQLMVPQSTVFSSDSFDFLHINNV